MTDKERSAKNIINWAVAGEKAVKLAEQTEIAKLSGEPMPEATPENVEITIRGSIKRFLDGDIADKQIKAAMQQAGLDMNNLRKSIVEKAMARAITKIINDGDIERLQEIGTAIGEAPTSGPAKITRERITIEINGDAVREVEAIEH